MYKEGSKNKAGHTGRAVALVLSVVFLWYWSAVLRWHG